MNKKEKPIVSSFGSIVAPLLVTTGLAAMLAGGMSKMFGTSEIPKGVVKEMMEGVMDGLLGHFEYKIDELKRDKKKLTEEIEKFEDRVEGLSGRLRELQKENENLKSKLKTKRKDKKKK